MWPDYFGLGGRHAPEYAKEQGDDGRITIMRGLLDSVARESRFHVIYFRDFDDEMVGVLFNKFRAYFRPD